MYEIVSPDAISKTNACGDGRADGPKESAGPPFSFIRTSGPRRRTSSSLFAQALPRRFSFPSFDVVLENIQNKSRAQDRRSWGPTSFSLTFPTAFWRAIRGIFRKKVTLREAICACVREIFYQKSFICRRMHTFACIEYMSLGSICLVDVSINGACVCRRCEKGMHRACWEQFWRVGVREALLCPNCLQKIGTLVKVWSDCRRQAFCLDSNNVPVFKIVSTYRPRWGDDVQEIYMNCMRQKAVIDAHLRAISVLRVGMADLRKEIRELEDEISCTENRVDY